MNCSLNVHDAARQYCKYMENKNGITVQTGSNGSFHTSITLFNKPVCYRL